MIPTAWDFRNQLSIILNTARHGGKPYIDVESESLHKQVEGHSSPSRRICRDVMMEMMRGGDSILKEYEESESLMIRYVLTAIATPQP